MILNKLLSLLMLISIIGDLECCKTKYYPKTIIDTGNAETILKSEFQNRSAIINPELEEQ